MKRVLAIWLPDWPVQRVVQSRPELAGAAVVLHGPSRRGESVAAYSAAARAAGVETGMPLAEAVVLAGTEVFEPHDPAADRAALVALAQWCHRFSPCAGLEDAEAPEALLLDATNLAPLYGGEAALVEQVARALRRRGLDARLALADTVAAALGLARSGSWFEIDAAPDQAATRRRSIARGASPGFKAAEEERSPGGAMVRSPRAPEACPPSPLRGSEDLSAALPRGSRPGLLTGGPLGLGGSRDAALAALPLAALRLPDDLLATLAHLGLTCVGEAIALPREQLRSRFGPQLVMRINQFTGATPEVILAVDPPEEFVAGEAFEHPLARGEAIAIVVRRLLERLAWLLAARRAGALAVACRFDCEGAPGAEFAFGLFRPTACARRLAELAELKLERLRLAGPVEAIEVQAVRHEPLAERQGTLFDEDSRSLDGSRQVAALVDRLAGRLGAQAVVGVRVVRDAQPEVAWREEPLVGGARRSKEASAGTHARRAQSKSKKKPTPGREGEAASGALERPLCLLPRPAAVEMGSVVPDGPPLWFLHRGRRYDVTRHWGPERIETGWWRRARAVRDYYRVETSAGQRFWLFRRRDGRWFLQGTF